MGRTDFLFAQPSFMAGVSRTLDLFATLREHSYNQSSSPETADAVAVESDWAVVGADMREGIRHFGSNEQEEE
jgi:hypothetical protein